jgi:hypothetical protein
LFTEQRTVGENLHSTLYQPSPKNKQVERKSTQKSTLEGFN